ncbi:hypothetical protein BD626DRAFT_492862 [Schizophyllum amplum]|uniref:DUF6534 domain-containing protein n=1 Tax=Schizophyllum amplum TaxID=97359 RepID=A0A550CGM7_9AGAR|nr:hypothetical protein BD626DRAFT_492862 [Auriculariopsis ampla]
MGAYDLTLGAYLVGVVLSAFMLGVACTQTATYFAIYPKDPWYIKFVVAFSLATTIGHQISVTDKMYVNTVTYYPDPAILGDIGWGLMAQTYFNALTAFTVQGFYFYRIYILLNRNWYFPAFLTAASVVQLIVAFVYAIKCSTIAAEQIPTLGNLVTTVNSIGAALDIIIAVTMVVILLRSRTGFKQTDTVISMLVTYVVNSGALTSACALGTLLALQLGPLTWVAYPFYFCLGRIYCISLLASLNARRRLRASSSGSRPDEYALSYHGATSSGNVSGNRAPAQGSVLVSIERTAMTDNKDAESMDDRKAFRV